MLDKGIDVSGNGIIIDFAESPHGKSKGEEAMD